MFKYTSKSEQNQILRNAQGKIIGKLVQYKLVKNVRGSKHMLLIPKAWAWDERAIDFTEKSGGKILEIKDVETNIIYQAPIELFRQYGIPINRGYGEQIALPLAYWTTNKSNVMQMSLFN